MAAPRRPLVIVDRFPLPAVTGGRQRMINYLLAVGARGPCDLVVLGEDPPDSDTELLDLLNGWSVHHVALVKKDQSRFRRLVGALSRGQSIHMSRLDIESAERSLAVLAGNRDLVVAIQPVSARVARSVRGQRRVVDLWDVEDARLARQLRVDRASGWKGIRHSLRWLVALWEIRYWRRFNNTLVARWDAVSVCSEDERSALQPSHRVWVVPNGADIEPHPPRREPELPPVILYHGQLTYGPNVDAATELVEDVLPIVQQKIPGTTARIVGRSDERLAALGSRPGVTVTGFVDDIRDELSRASVLIVPLRTGGGTRLKILEAFAAMLPVVSTPVGAEGIDAVDGEHLLVAEEPVDLAAAAVRLLTEPGERDRITNQARSLVAERYDWTVIRTDLSQRISGLEHRG